MSILVIRHGLSEANNRENTGNLAFANQEAPLMEIGRQQAANLGHQLEEQYAINATVTAAAISELRRTQETARCAGFTACTAYESLDEVKHGMELPDLRRMLDKGELPKVALQEAGRTLESLPAEAIWFSHGLRIAGLCALLGVYQEDRLIPHFCEIRELPL